MTTICWDGQTLAADSASTTDHGTQTAVQKMAVAFPSCVKPVIGLAHKVLLAASGATDVLELVREWLEDHNPFSRIDLEESGVVVMVACYSDSPPLVFIMNRSRPLRVIGSYHAEGAGAGVALGALALRATSVLALEVAERHNDSTARPFWTLEPTDEEPKLHEGTSIAAG